MRQVFLTVALLHLGVSGCAGQARCAENTTTLELGESVPGTDLSTRELFQALALGEPRSASVTWGDPRDGEQELILPSLDSETQVNYRLILQEESIARLTRLRRVGDDQTRLSCPHSAVLSIPVVLELWTDDGVFDESFAIDVGLVEEAAWRKAVAQFQLQGDYDYSGSFEFEARGPQLWTEQISAFDIIWDGDEITRGTIAIVLSQDSGDHGFKFTFNLATW